MRIQTGDNDRGDVGACLSDTMTTPSDARQGKLAGGITSRRSMSTGGPVGNSGNVQDINCKVGADKLCDIHYTWLSS